MDEVRTIFHSSITEDICKRNNYYFRGITAGNVSLRCHESECLVIKCSGNLLPVLN